MTLKRVSLVSVALLVALGLGASPALAAPPGTPTPGPTSPPPTGGDTGNGSQSGGRIDQVSDCTVVATPGYLGLACGHGGEVRTVKEILGNDPVPECWDEAMSQKEIDAAGYGELNGHWYWHWCLLGINKKTKTVEPGGIHFTVGIISIDPPKTPGTLTHNQWVLVDLKRNDGYTPMPVAGTSPNARPRVGGWVSFFDISTPHVVSVPAGGLVLRARESSIDVNPLGEGTDPTISCKGSGYQAKTGQTRADHPSGCWYKYLESSATQPDNVFPVHITAHWTVETAPGAAGPWTMFTTFDKSQDTTMPVSEIEALVVP